MPFKSKLTLEQKQDLLKLYNNQISVKELCDLFDMYPSNIIYNLRKLGAIIRNDKHLNRRKYKYEDILTGMVV